MRRNLVILSALIGVGICYAGQAHAAITQADLSTPGFMSSHILTALSNIQTRVTTTLGSSYDISSSSTYTSWCRAILLGAWVCKLVETTGRMAVFNDPYVGIINVLITGIIVTALYSTYGGWTYGIVDGGQYLGLLVQKQAMGGDGIMQPAQYILSVWAKFQFVDGNLFSMGLAAFACNCMFMLFEIILFAAALFCCVWPSLVAAVAVIVGPLAFIFVFHESVSFVFNGWLKMLFWAALFAFVSRICIVVICLLFAAVFDYQVGFGGLGQDLVTLDSNDTLSFLILSAMAICSLALLFFAGVLTSMLTGSQNIDASQMVAKGGKAAGAAIMSAIAL